MTKVNEPDDYWYVWDSESDWALIKGLIPILKLFIEFEGDAPNSREIMALRKLFQQFRDMPLKAFVEQIGTSKQIYIGLFSGYELHFLVPKIRGFELKEKTENESYKGFIPYQPSTGSLMTRLAYENRQLFETIVGKLLLKGVPIIDLQVEID